MTMTRNGTPPNPDRMINQALIESAQIPPETTQDGLTSSSISYGYDTRRGSILPPRGTRQRELALKDFYFMDEMDLLRGAFTNIAKIIASVGWEIKGDNDKEDSTVQQLARQQNWLLKRNTGVEYFQEMFRQSNFGDGWTTFITQVMLDYLRYDAGAYIEVIGAGNTYAPLLGPVMGLSHIDPLRTYPTGDPLYPAVYYDRYGGIHVFHHSRLIRLVDMNDGDEARPGYGDSALSRAISVAIKELWMSRYITTRLDDQPAPGFTIIGGIMSAEWKKTDQQYIDEQGRDNAPIWGRRKFYFTPDAEIMPKVENVDFQSSPENFDYRNYTDINVDRLANAIGVDRQEIMALVSGNLGSGQQSTILSQKSKGKTIGVAFQQLERKLNDVLPPDFTFEFQNRDSQETLQEQQISQVVATTAASMTAALTPDEIRTYLANNIEGVRDAISDTPRANDVFNQPYVAADDTPGAAPVAPAATPQVNVNDNVDEEIKAQKDYPTTQAMFVQDVRDLLMSAVTPNPYLDRRAFTVTMRSFLKNYGLQAYKDGMRQGGVTVDTLDPEDNVEYMSVFLDQAQYIAGLADAVFKDKAITPDNAQDRAMMWGKSLQLFDDAGLISADRNGMYRYKRGLTSDSCVDCKRLDGQVHRLKTYKARNRMPRSNSLACKGYRCLCSLERTTERARGRF